MTPGKIVFLVHASSPSAPRISPASHSRFALAALVIRRAGRSPARSFDLSDTWQLIVNTGTTIITFLMVFLIQSTQNRDAEAVHVKLDELLRVSPGAHNVLMNLEELEEDELDRIRSVYVQLAEKARAAVSKTGAATKVYPRSASCRKDDRRRPR